MDMKATHTTNSQGTIEWRLPNGLFHREDGPAYEGVSGTKEWWVNGQLHRLDGPAIEWADGTKAWYINGQRHRTDGPAYEGVDGRKEWYLNGEWIDGRKFKQAVKELNAPRLDNHYGYHEF